MGAQAFAAGRRALGRVMTGHSRTAGECLRVSVQSLAAPAFLVLESGVD